MDEVLQIIREDLLANIEEGFKEKTQRFFKNEVKVYGLRMGEVKKISKKYFSDIKILTKEEIFDLCELLWQSDYLEEHMIASHWAHALKKQYTEKDFIVFTKWIDKYINNWATCDTFCNHVIGDFIMMYPHFIEKLFEFTASENRWVKRAAAVSLVVPARKGMYLDSIFTIAEKLLLDPDDMVQKGYGWMLKEASKKHQKAVFIYVLDRREIMPRTSLRYAIEKMPKEMRQEAMKRN